MSRKTPEGLPRIEIPNVRVANDAQQFRKTAEFLFANINRHGCLLPLLMVASFAMELSLKALNTENVYHSLAEEMGPIGEGAFRVTANPMQKGHELVKLFDKIDPTVRGELERAYEESPSLAGEASVREALARYDGLFEDSRYSFEDGKEICKGSINDLMHLVTFVGIFVDNLPKRRLPD